jgi:hypothetical protein
MVNDFWEASVGKYLSVMGMGGLENRVVESAAIAPKSSVEEENSESESMLGKNASSMLKSSEERLASFFGKGFHIVSFFMEDPLCRCGPISFRLLIPLWPVTE